MVAMLGKELGFPHETDLQKLFRRFLNQQIGSTELLSKKQLEKAIPRHVLKISTLRQDAISSQVVTDWYSKKSVVNEREEIDLREFAATVHHAVRHCPSGHFGTDRVFISHVWQYLSNQQLSWPRLDLVTFKSHLFQAHQQGLLTLNRADLVQAMNPHDVQESEISILNSTFHFILIPQDSHQ